jgi:trimeric autotransporter adhesin
MLFKESRMQQTLSRASRSLVRRSLFLTTVLSAAFAGTQAWAQTQPPANTVIGNQATATYTDSANIQRTASSNTVQTTVLQVAAIDLTADNTKQAPPGSPVYFPHTVVNNGNGTDTITLSAADNTSGDNFNIGPLTIYADADGNGLPDNTTAITSTGPLTPGQSFRFVVAGTVPSTGPTAGQVARITVTATSGTHNGTTDTDTNTDTVQFSTNAVVNLQKSINVNRGPSPSGPYTYTLTYSNIGNAAATNVEIEDVIPTGMTYVGNSGRWSVTPTVTLTDLNTDDQSGITYVISGQTVTATIASVPVGATGSVSFQVNARSSESGTERARRRRCAVQQHIDQPGHGSRHFRHHH